MEISSLPIKELANTFRVESESNIILDLTLRSNASEVDPIVWLHSLKLCAQKILIFSPDMH